MAERFSLKDHLFNGDTVGRLAAEYAAAVPGFDAARFEAEALAGFPDRELMARLEWMADCLEPQLAMDFPAMADQLEAAMPAPLDPALRDDDFGHFIHALPGILAVRHGLEAHRDRALDLLYAATQRFSMEFYIRPFLNRWPDETLARLAIWARDDNYHVRRLVSEGTRPRLPWARAVRLETAQTGAVSGGVARRRDTVRDAVGGQSSERYCQDGAGRGDRSAARLGRGGAAGRERAGLDDAPRVAGAGQAGARGRTGAVGVSARCDG